MRSLLDANAWIHYLKNASSASGCSSCGRLRTAGVSKVRRATAVVPPRACQRKKARLFPEPCLLLRL